MFHEVLKLCLHSCLVKAYFLFQCQIILHELCHMHEILLACRNKKMLGMDKNIRSTHVFVASGDVQGDR